MIGPNESVIVTEFIVLISMLFYFSDSYYIEWRVQLHWQYYCLFSVHKRGSKYVYLTLYRFFSLFHSTIDTDVLPFFSQSQHFLFFYIFLFSFIWFILGENWNLKSGQTNRPMRQGEFYLKTTFGKSIIFLNVIECKQRKRSSERNDQRKYGKNDETISLHSISINIWGKQPVVPHTEYGDVVTSFILYRVSVDLFGLCFLNTDKPNSIECNVYDF